MRRREFEAAPVMAGLKAFQRATVEHVVERFYGPNPATRFLVADETGLGKSLVARGVIARTIEHLQQTDAVARIDVVYVCSNLDIAQQNISRLDVTGDPHLPFASRLTLLAKHSQRLAIGGGKFKKPVNLISFTPGTSFEMGWQTGKAEERAMLFLLLEDLVELTGYRRRAAINLLRGQVGHHDRFLSIVEQLERELPSEIDPTVARGFAQAVRRQGLLREFEDLIDQMGRRRNVPDALRGRTRTLTGTMRRELARVSVHTLEPDLIILDEFQRFRDLLNEETEAGELAHHLFNYQDARVLLLSATPYKPFTYAEEDLDDHHQNFVQTLRFLASGNSEVNAEDVAAELASFRKAAVTGASVTRFREQLRGQLLKVMCRSERPEASATSMFVERVTPAGPLADDDLVGYVALRRLSEAVDGQMTVEYFKSAPYFVNFCDGYQLGERLRRELRDERARHELLPLVRRAQRLDRGAVRTFKRIDYANGRLRRIASETVDAGWWKLLWIPPSLPYLVPSGPYAEAFAQNITKRLVFSSWSATPTAIASLLSYEAERKIAEGTRLTENTPAARRAMANRLAYNLEGGRPLAMTTLALFWPMPGLAALADPLKAARKASEPVDQGAAVSAIAGRLAATLPQDETSRAAGTEAWYWAAAVGMADSLPADVDDASALRGMSGELDAGDDLDDDPAGIAAHVALALRARAGTIDLPAPPPDLAETVAMLGMHSPANIAWRALDRVAHDQTQVTQRGHWLAAAVLAGGLRSLFSRLDATLLLDKLFGRDVYWRAVLQYCAAGNLQAVLDEYIHHFVVSEGILAIDDDRLADIAAAAASAISLRPSRYEAFDPLNPDRPIAFSSRFALRYGGRRQNEESSRQPEIRRAFNSPFWPFVLATTSVGQEGLDFHWWSHAVVHWNTPANPVDFEQREGRVHRYAGHAIRRNIAHRHRDAILGAADPNPWRFAYVAADDRPDDGEFSPYWVYPGPTRIERHVAPYPLSVDGVRLDRLKDELALYRLTFGQPRQEDMLELLRRRGIQKDGSAVAELQIDLRPPGSDHAN